MIRDSIWQKQIDTSKVRNLTTNEISTHALELLSLGADFRLQGSNKSILDTIIAFYMFETIHRNEPGRPDLQRDKVKLVSSMKKDTKKSLPRRYDVALKSLETNRNIMVVQSDKGKETIVCYRNTYLILLESHFSNINFYQIVGEEDDAGFDLDCMTNNLKNYIDLLAEGAPDQIHKKLIKSLHPPKEPRFPEGRISLKTHKNDITENHIPV